MKFTIKGVCFTLLVILFGFFLLIFPSFVMNRIKNYMIMLDNEKESQLEDHWIFNDTGRRFEYHDGTFAQNTSQEIDGVTYYFDEKGYVRTGWVQEMGNLYYRNPDGTPETGWFEDDQGKYYLDENGAPKTGWAEIDEKKYYFSSLGVMAVGFTEIDGKEYLFSDDGSVSPGWTDKDGKKGGSQPAEKQMTAEPEPEHVPQEVSDGQT